MTHIFLSFCVGGGTEIHTQAFLALVSGIFKTTYHLRFIVRCIVSICISSRYTPATEPGGCTGTRQPLSISAKGIVRVALVFFKCLYR